MTVNLKQYPGASIFPKQLGLKNQERVLILTDRKALTKPSEIIRLACLEITPFVQINKTLPSEVEDEIPQKFQRSMLASEVIILMAFQSWYHAPLRRKLKYEFGKRVVESYGLTEEVLQKGGLLAEYNQVANIGKKLAVKLKSKKNIRIVTTKGTDLRAKIVSFGLETGWYERPGTGGNLPAGEISILPQDASGKVIFDLIADKLGKLDKSPVEIIIEKNKVKNFSSPAQDFFCGDKLLRNVAEISLGTNSWSCLDSANVLEVEKKLGTAHLGFGNDTYFGGKIDGRHLDAVFDKPTVFVDTRLIMKDGELV